MKRRDLLLVFLITLIPRLVLSLQAYPLVYISDETSAISVAALIAGFDWTNAVSHAGYYGIGYFFLFAPLFHIIKNPIWIYRVVLVISAVIVALSAPICYIVLYKFFSLKNRLSRILIATLCGALNLFTAMQMTIKNEEILYLIIWNVVYILCDILNKSNLGKSYKKKEILLLFLLGYALTIHTRAVCLIIGIIFIEALYRAIYKKGIIHKWSYPVIAIVYFIVNSGLKLYQSRIWEQGTKNTSVLAGVESTLSKISNFFDVNLYLNIFRIIFGQTYTAGAVSGGLCIVVFFILIFWLMGKNNKESDTGNYIFVIGSMFLFCTIITICGMSVTWLSAVTNNIAKHGEGVFSSSYRAFGYLRYMGCYVSPFVMCALVIVEKDKKILRKAVLLATAVMCVLTLFWLKFILPYVYNGKIDFYVALGNMKANENVSYQNWHVACIRVLAIMIVGLLLAYVKKEKVYFALIIVMLIGERIYGFRQYTIVTGQNNYMKANSGYELIQKMQEEKEIQNVYVYDESASTFYIYQFLNWTIKIIPELPENVETDILVFSNQDLDKILDGTYYWAKLDDNEYVYCTGEDYFQLIEKCGMEMQKSK